MTTTLSLLEQCNKTMASINIVASSLQATSNILKDAAEKMKTEAKKRETAEKVNEVFKDPFKKLLNSVLDNAVNGSGNISEMFKSFFNDIFSGLKDIASKQFSEAISGKKKKSPQQNAEGGEDDGQIDEAKGGVGEQITSVLKAPFKTLLSDLLKHVIKGTKSISEIFKEFWKTAVINVGGILSEKLSSMLFDGDGGIGGILGGLMSKVTDTVGGWVKTAISFFSGLFKNFFGFADGGYVKGPGTSSSDSIPARLSNGEYVIKANAVSFWGLPFMNMINNMAGPGSLLVPTIPQYAGGGLVSSAALKSGGSYKGEEEQSLNQVTDLLRTIAGKDMSVSLKNVNVLTPQALAGVLREPSGRKVLMNFLGRERSSIGG